ncbi:unnamed protein product, partial [Prorocentrum cordatum]
AGNAFPGLTSSTIDATGPLCNASPLVDQTASDGHATGANGGCSAAAWNGPDNMRQHVRLAWMRCRSCFTVEVPDSRLAEQSKRPLSAT